MFRSWGKVTLTGAAQPWFGDVTTAAVGLPNGFGIIPVTVASTTRYQVGDRIYLDPEQANQDIVIVDSIPSATVLNCRSEGTAPTHTHSIGAIIQLSLACRDVIIQNIGADLVVLGSDDTVALTGGGSAFYELQPATSPAQPNDFRTSPSSAVNADRTEDGWMIGTSGQTVFVAAKVL
jgi:hypothetical protein